MICIRSLIYWSLSGRPGLMLRAVKADKPRLSSGGQR